eukprot:TRINITY_DN3244_c0_g1_i3.p1 TRINITY_DN3244_c0_g1~~TRINITY_DN3244_c0_g1_i3.p1  ORF type:complete len:195 (+),score=39.15 TRINITY_DN3244_c0_g1_i3:310-894(+)
MAKKPKKDEANEKRAKKGDPMFSFPIWDAPPTGAPSRAPTTAGGLSRSASVPATAKTEHSQLSRSSACSRASVKELVEKSVARQLRSMSTHAHYIEQTLGVGERPSLSAAGNFRPKTEKCPDDLEELIYYGVSANEQGRHAYLHQRKKIMPKDRLEMPDTEAQKVGWNSYEGPGKFVGMQLKPASPRRATIALM